MSKFSAVWKDSGFLTATPPFLVVPHGGIGLVYLNGVKSLNSQQDLKFNRMTLKVTIVSPNQITKHLLKYSQNFPAKWFAAVLALAGEMHNSIRFGSVLLAIEGRGSDHTVSLDYLTKTAQAKLDVYTADRRAIAISFRFIRYLDAAGALKGGTSLAPPYAEELVEILNRLYLPSANIEFQLKSSEYATVNRPLGQMILKEQFKNHIVPHRDAGADLTVFFVGKYKGTTDPLGEAFSDLDCVVVDDAPWQYIAPETTWPRRTLTDDEINYAGRPLDRPKSDRDLHIVLAHEIAHWLGAGHNNEPDNLMSMGRQDFKLSKETVKSISGK